MPFSELLSTGFAPAQPGYPPASSVVSQAQGLFGNGVVGAALSGADLGGVGDGLRYSLAAGVAGVPDVLVGLVGPESGHSVSTPFSNRHWPVLLDVARWLFRTHFQSNPQNVETKPKSGPEV